MTKAEKLAAFAERLSEDQLDVLISFAQSISAKPYRDTAPPEALASLERGLAQIARGETVSVEELSRRLEVALKPANG